jgi:glyoxylase-like metal-dependent hydrolase (beta-lactamase superfamily II)
MRYFKVVFILFLAVITINAQSRFDKVEIKTMEIKDNLYLLQGSGGNIAILTGEDGVLMVDSQFDGLAEKNKAAIKKLSDHSVNFLINTHWHGDHTGGNGAFSNDGATVVAHQNVRKRLSKDELIQAFSREIKAKPKAYWPVITYSEDMQVHFNEEDIFLMHVHNAHTDGDGFVYFSKHNVLHMGDTYFQGRFPFIDLSTGGSLDGLIEAVQAAMMLCDTETVIIPGHGSLSDKKELFTYYTMLNTMKNRLESAIAEGKTIEEMKTMGLDKGYEEWGTGFISSEKMIDQLWTDYNREKE